MKKLFLLSLLSVLLGAFAVAQVPTNGLVGYWSFTGNANDQSTSANHGTVNGATLTADRFGNPNSAYSFDGTGQYIQCLNPGPTGTNSRTISIWLKSTSSKLNQSLIGWGNNDVASQDWRLILNSTCGQDLTVGITGNNRDVTYTGASNWTHFAVVYDNNAGTKLTATTLYVNGVKMSSYCSDVTNNNINTGGTNPITFGVYSWLAYSGGLASSAFNGVLDDVRLYDRPLNDTEVKALFNEGVCFQSLTVTDTLTINLNTTGFNPITYSNNIKIYPNPTNDQLNISIANGNNNGYTIKIVNSLSQVMYQQNITGSSYVVNLNTFSTGTYFVNVLDSSGNLVEVRKIVLQ